MNSKSDQHINNSQLLSAPLHNDLLTLASLTGNSNTLYLYSNNGQLVKYDEAKGLVPASDFIRSQFTEIGQSTGLHKQTKVYELSSNQAYPLLFLVAPVANEQTGNISGAVALHISQSSINAMLRSHHLNNGLGQSGESYLVGNDYFMRSDSRFIKNSVSGIKVNSKAVFNAFEKKEGTSIIKDYRGIEVLSSYSKLNIPGLNWIILSEIDTREALASVNEIRNNILLISTVIALILFIYAFFASARFTSPIIKLKKATQQIGSGNFEPKLDIHSNDEIGDLVKSFKNMMDQLKIMTTELKLERFKRLRSVIDGQEIERQRLSRELHDGLGQLMIALKLKLENTHGADFHQTRKIIQEVNESFDLTIEEIRRISNNLMPAVLNEFGIVNAVRSLAEDIEEHSGITVNFVSTNINTPLNRKHKTYLYRIVQEALNNAVKHAKASLIKLELYQTDHCIHITVEDNGCGFDYDESINNSGNGINNMSERCSLIQGQFNIKTAPGKGTIVRAIIPTG
ncbi:MAG: HAMP domain-containing protein [Bacteroidales bacterium]|nr:HAMP domain-containing protein [Bacteroidales bacterium]